MSNSFIVGEKYTNNDIVRDFKCGNMGGMRKSNTLNALILFQIIQRVSMIINGMGISYTTLLWVKSVIKI